MSPLLLSSENETFVALEQVYGQAANITTAQQIVASTLQIAQHTATSARRDKSGVRTCSRTATGIRTTSFHLSSFVTSQAGSGIPICDPLFAAAMGSVGAVSAPVTIASSETNTTFLAQSPHGLTVGSGLSYGGEIRFVANVTSPQAFQVNAPFSNNPGQNDVLSSAVTYRLANVLPSFTAFDFWGSQGSFTRILVGAIVNEFAVNVSGDRHIFSFAGSAADLINSASFASGSAGLSVLPQLPEQAPVDYSIVPGHLGQVWFGNPIVRSRALTRATIRLQNNVVLRDREVGSGLPRVIVPGRRNLEIDFSFLTRQDEGTTELYEIAANRGTTSVLLQLGQQAGQIMGIYLPCVMPSVPVYDDSSEWLTWHVNQSPGVGDINDELYLAFA